MGLEIADGLALHLTSTTGGLMIVRGNSSAMVIPVGILGNIAVALSRGIIISHASVVYVGWVRFEVTKYDNCVREAIIVLEFESLYIESVAMGNYIVTGLLVVAAGLIGKENIAHHVKVLLQNINNLNMRPLTEEETQSVFEKLAK